jgi:hypothetical protein
MMPEACEHGGKLLGVVTTLGVATALRSGIAPRPRDLT